MDGWRRAFGYAIGVPSFNNRYFTHPTWVVSTASGTVRGAGQGWKDIYPLASDGLRIEGLMLIAVDVIIASTDTYGGAIRGAWGGRLELVLASDEGVPIHRQPRAVAARR